MSTIALIKRRMTDELDGKQSESGGCQRIGGGTHGILSYSYCDSCVNK